MIRIIKKMSTVTFLQWMLTILNKNINPLRVCFILPPVYY